MGDYKLSNAAKRDLSSIYEFGIETFGIHQARIYLNKLHKAFLILAENRELGHYASEFAKGLRRYIFDSHAVFYLPINSGVFYRKSIGAANGL
ncbi:MAG: type II toxin-antitoxin system RelE/ParE family toxin [Bacteroidota bacterium]